MLSFARNYSAVVTPEVPVVPPPPAAPSPSQAAPQRLDSVLSVTTAAESLVDAAPATSPPVTPPNPVRAESKLTHAASFEDTTLPGRVSKAGPNELRRYHCTHTKTY